MQAAGHVGDGDHLRAALVQLGGRDTPDLAEALDDAALPGEIPAEAGAGAFDHHHDPGAGRLRPEDGAADRDRLAGDDLRNGMADLHRVRVHHPGHRLLVGRHVGRRDVLLRADHGQELGGEPARDRLQLALGHRARVAADPALRAAVGQLQQRALPGHPHRERRALAERDVRVVPDPAFRRAEDARVLDAVTRVDRPPAVVELDRDCDDQRALGDAQALGDGLADVGVGQRLLELGERRVEQGRFPLERLLGRQLVGARHPGSVGRSRFETLKERGAGADPVCVEQRSFE